MNISNPNNELLKAINSPAFTLYTCIELLCKHADSIGIHYYLCQRLLTFPHSEIQFYIPQLVQILLTIETESMALEDLLMRLKNENPHFALLTFWQLQALLTDLSTDPESYGFQVARRVLNNLQSSLFNTNPYIDDTSTHNSSSTSNPSSYYLTDGKSIKMHENVAPAIVYTSMIMSAMAFPELSKMTKPLVESQGRRQKSYVFKLARNAMKDLTRNLTLKNTLLNGKKNKKYNTNEVQHDMDDKIRAAIEANSNYRSKSTSTMDRKRLNHSNSMVGSPILKHNSFDQRRSSSHDTITTSLNSTFDIIDSTMTREDIMFKKPRKKDAIQQATLDFSIVDDIGNQLFEEKISTSIKLPKRKSKFLAKNGSSSTEIYKNTAMSTTTSDGEDISVITNNDNAFINGNLSKDRKSILSNYENFTKSLPDLHKVTPSKPSISSNLKKSILQENNINSSSRDTNNSNDSISTSTTITTTTADTPRHSFDVNDMKTRRTLVRSNTQPPSHFDMMRQKKTSSYLAKEVDISKLSTTKKIKLLKTNYFRCATQFAIALESISQRLAQVPTEARLSALRAELSLMNRDLPAEVDIPTLLPPNKKGKLHRLVTITASEAQVLNSAEKVPYLLFIEYLRDDFDFDPTSDENENILKHNSANTSPLFDLNYLSKKIHNRNDWISLIPGAQEDNMLTTDSSTIATTDTRHHQHQAHISDIKEYYNLQNTSLDNTITKYPQREMDLGDVSIVKMKNRSDIGTYRNDIMLNVAEKVPIIESDSSNRSPELKFVQNMDEVISLDNEKSVKGQFMGPNETEDLAEQMRISALMLNQLDQSPQALSDSTNQIRAQIIMSMKEVQDKFGYRDLEAIHGKAGERKLENDMMTGGIDTSYLGEDWQTKKERIRKQSKYGHLENWSLCSVIAKSGDDLRQEAFACQVIQAMAQIWAKEKTDVWVKKMRILITSASTGLVETITNAMSVHSIKKALTKKMIEDHELDERGGIATLTEHFVRAFGNPEGFKYKRAQSNFASSLAAYSLICYILRVKDRHNGNIMIDNEGHVVHIDFGFMLSNSPGSVGFEASPFKLTYEYIDVLGGLNGSPYKKYVQLMKDGFKALRKYSDQIVSMCEIMQKDNMQPCFEAGDQTSVQLKDRFRLDLKTDTEVDKFVENDLIGKSMGNVYTRLYDQFQLVTQGILS